MNSLLVEAQGKTSNKAWQMRDSLGFTSRAEWVEQGRANHPLQLSQGNFWPKLFVAVEVYLKGRCNGFLQGSLNEHKRKMFDHEKKKQQS
nr:hypothetical protein [Tanacetum cinerariifolium]